MASTTAAASLRLKHASSSSTPASTDGEFITFKATMRIPIPPVFNSKGEQQYPGHDGGMDGVREVLAGWVMRYLPPLRAVLLSFSPTPRFLHPSAPFPASESPFRDALQPLKSSSNGYLASPPPEEDDEGEKETVRLKTLPMVLGSGFTLAMVEWEGVGWRPRVGMKLVGTPTLSTPSHVSLLLHNLFNASIPSSHIPLDAYEFDADAAVPAVVLERRNTAVPLKKLTEKVTAKAEGAVEGEEEEEKAKEDEEVKDEEAEEEEQEEEEEEAFSERGWWVHRKTREPLGGKEGRIEFTLVGLTTSNSLLSCTGSLLSDPFAPSALAALKQPAPYTSTSSFPSSAAARAAKNGKKRRFDSDEDTGSSSSESPSESDSDDSDSDSDSSVDGDDDDRVGTGIPSAKLTSKAGPPRVRAASVASSAASESSRSPSPLPEPKTVGKGNKGKKEKEGKEDGRKSKKARTTA
ncbi:hypothetical protein JCM10207_006268 [Rhodosporidiobolus poonsookiae]